ncbi:DNA replication protein [Martiniozyma asiatica (nom. inval.)]|nr:DNA replication protein [Martiniozyma asiatica]
MMFIAEETPIQVISKTKLPEMTLISTKISAMAALDTATLPLWLALLLRRLRKVAIVAPQWMTPTELELRIAEEQAHPDRVSHMPWQWLEVSERLLNEASQDFTFSPHDTRSLIATLAELRQNKARAGFASMDGEYLELTGLGAREVDQLRPLVGSTMHKLSQLAAVEPETEVEIEN